MRGRAAARGAGEAGPFPLRLEPSARAHFGEATNSTGVWAESAAGVHCAELRGDRARRLRARGARSQERGPRGAETGSGPTGTWVARGTRLGAPRPGHPPLLPRGMRGLRPRLPREGARARRVATSASESSTAAEFGLPTTRAPRRQQLLDRKVRPLPATGDVAGMATQGTAEAGARRGPRADRRAPGARRGRATGGRDQGGRGAAEKGASQRGAARRESSRTGAPRPDGWTDEF